MEFQTTNLCDARRRQGPRRSPCSTAMAADPLCRPDASSRFLRTTPWCAPPWTPGQWRVLVVDAAAPCAVRCWATNSACSVSKTARQRDRAGCIRDSGPLARMDLGVFALATHPMKSVKKRAPAIWTSVAFGGVAFVPPILYADEDRGDHLRSPLL